MIPSPRLDAFGSLAILAGAVFPLVVLLCLVLATARGIAAMAEAAGRVIERMIHE
jgi:hypothetical protein